MMKKLFLILFFSPFFCSAQEEMETDRPDQTECSSVIQPRFMQIETGVVYSKDHDIHETTDQESSIFNYGTTLIRIGVSRTAEMRLEIGEYEKSKIITNGQHSSIEGFTPFVVGAKFAVCEERGFIPKIAFLGHLRLPFGDKKFVVKNEILPFFRFSLSHSLGPKLSLGYNLGMEWESRSLNPNYVYTLTLAADITKEMGLYIETYGSFSYSSFPENYFDGGLTYNLLENLKFDASVGFALNKVSTDFFLSVGISMRLPH